MAAGQGLWTNPGLMLWLFFRLCFTSPLCERTPQPRMEPMARTHSCLSGRSTVTCVTLTVHISHPPSCSSGSPGQPCASKTEAQRQPAVPQGAPAWPLTHGGGVWPRKGRERPAWARKEMVQVAGLRAAL